MKVFYMVTNDGGSMSTTRHGTIDAAKLEAVKLCGANRTPTHVLMVIATAVPPDVKWDTTAEAAEVKPAV